MDADTITSLLLRFFDSRMVKHPFSRSTSLTTRSLASEQRSPHSNNSRKKTGMTRCRQGHSEQQWQVSVCARLLCTPAGDGLFCQSGDGRIVPGQVPVEPLE